MRVSFRSLALPVLLTAAPVCAQDVPTAEPTPDAAPSDAPYAVPGEDKVDPYVASDANAGAKPFDGQAMVKAFHGQDGIRRIADGFVERVYADPVTGEIFKGHDKVRFSRTIFEQFCYILNAGCHYSGRDMMSAHKDLGTQHGDMNRVVELLQQSMVEEHVSFRAQNRFLSKLAPMRGKIVER